MSDIAALLPVVAVCSIGYALRERYGRRGAMLVASVIAGILAVLLTELLSLLHAISSGPLTFMWAIIAIAGVFLAIRSPRPAVRDDIASWFASEYRGFWIAIGSVLVLTMVTALLAAVNTSDSLVYHMPRVAHWAQNKNVDVYPTNILRQLHPAPFAEFVMLHLQVLTGTDRFVNLVQWSAVAGLGVGASVIARELGAGRRGQLLSALIIVSTPIAVAEASSTQTDAVTAFWLVAFVAVMLSVGGDSTRQSVLLGGCLGLAALTKGTAYVFGLPLVVWLVVTRAKAGPASVLRTLAIAFTIAFLLNVAFFARNQRVYGRPLGPPGETARAYKYANDSHDPRAVISNAVRNVGLHLGVPSSRVNDILTRVLAGSMRRIGIDPDDPRTTWTETTFRVDWCVSDSCAGNPVQLLLAAVCFVLVFLGSHRDSGGRSQALAISVVVAFIAFCALLKWQPWHSRLQLPLFALAAPIIGLVVERQTRAWASSLLTVELLICAFAVLLLDPLRPLVGEGSIFSVTREESYLRGHPAMAQPLRRIVEAIASSNCSEIGLFSHDYEEYALWAFARNRLPGTLRIEHVGVVNASAFLATKSPYVGFAPCAVVALGRDEGPELQIGRKAFIRRDLGAEGVQLYLPKSSRAAPPSFTQR